MDKTHSTRLYRAGSPDEGHAFWTPSEAYARAVHPDAALHEAQLLPDFEQKVFICTRSHLGDLLLLLAPVTLLANSPTVLVVPPAFPANSLAEFIATARARPGELNYASYGAGSGPHLATEMFMAMTGTRMVHVPYGGGAPAALGTMTNQVQALFASVLPVLGMIRGGSLKAIAIASDHRSALLPGVPTFTESGSDYRTGTWFGLLAPAQTPPEIVPEPAASHSS